MSYKSSWLNFLFPPAWWTSWLWPPGRCMQMRRRAADWSGRYDLMLVTCPCKVQASSVRTVTYTSSANSLSSRVFADKDAMIAGALEMAGEIAGRSPVAVQGTKVNLVYSRDHSVAEGLDYMVTTFLISRLHFSEHARVPREWCNSSSPFSRPPGTWACFRLKMWWSQHRRRWRRRVPSK